MAKSRTIRPGIMMGIVMLVYIFGGACAHSPQDELNKARVLFASLEQSDALKYIPRDIQRLRSRIIQAETLIRSNQFMVAEQHIRACIKDIQRAFKTYQAKKEAAKAEAHAFMTYFETQLQRCITLAAEMPRLTYVEQNRYDIVRTRLKSLYRRLKLMQHQMQNREYLSVLKEKEGIEDDLAFIEDTIQSSKEPTTPTLRAEYLHEIDTSEQSPKSPDARQSLLVER